MKQKVRTQLGEQDKEVYLYIPLNHLSAVFTISDLLNGQKNQRFVSTPVLTDTYQRTQIGRIFYVGIVYLLGPSKKSKANGFDYDE